MVLGKLTNGTKGRESVRTFVNRQKAQKWNIEEDFSPQGETSCQTPQSKQVHVYDVVCILFINNYHEIVVIILTMK